MVIIDTFRGALFFEVDVSGEFFGRADPFRKSLLYNDKAATTDGSRLAPSMNSSLLNSPLRSLNIVYRLIGYEMKVIRIVHTVSITAKILSTRSSGLIEISSWKFSECSTKEKTDETI